MSTTPPLPSGSSTASNTDEWRSSVEQSYRNREVREIAKILASLEPGATFATKLRLATDFENTMFTSATSLVDYRKRIQKRLKKLQKSYKPPAATPETNDKMVQERLLQLKQKYGDTLKLIVECSHDALRFVKEKHGMPKAQQLKVHTENAKQWAIELGVFPDRRSTAAPTSTVGSVEKLAQLLQQRVENIRSHVVKYAKPDLFLKETIEKLQPEISETNMSITLSEATRKAAAADALLSQNDEMLLSALQESMLIVTRPIPPPTRQQQSDKLYIRNEALAHLDKLRAASQVYFLFLSLKDKKRGVPENILAKCHDVSIAATRRLEEISSADRKEAKGNIARDKKVLLEDAWNKTMEYPTSDGGDKLISTVPIRSRVLLTPGSKPKFSNLFPELKRKGAKLITPGDNEGDSASNNYYLVLEFEKAFRMTIHLVPLLVQIQELRGTDLEEKSSFSLWGISSKNTGRTLNHAVQQKLRYASVRATAVLRHCFALSASSSNRSDFEVEISEATALLQFIQIAQSTYVPSS